jgi:hypothetical protein
VLGVATFHDSGEVVAAQGEAFGGPLAGYEEGLDVLRDADFHVAAEFPNDFGGVVFV